MKKAVKRNISILLFIAVVALLVILYSVQNRRVEIVRVPVAVPVYPQEQPSLDRPDTRKTPEYRGPPLKYYKPGATQQMGLLFDPLTNQTLPLFGKEVQGRRDQYNYYTTVSDNFNLYPVPLSYNNRDCMDTQVGCNELYGGERLSVLGKDNEFEAKIYKTENFY